MKINKFEVNETVICVKNYKNITIGNEYKIISKDFSYVYINNDLGSMKGYYFEFFMNLRIYNVLHRIDKINNINKV